MGYETTLLIGKTSASTLCHTPGFHSKVSFFSIYATIDLYRCGSDSHILKVDRINISEDTVYYWYYDGLDAPKYEDRYGDKLKPVPISVVINALRKDVKQDDYGRYKWALALLRSMERDKEDNIGVLLYGH
ncbi:MAG: hypothetical protein GY931_11485 [Maribacter sp.]|nr:hypothetical protein [Maribacter sp.]